MKVGQGLGVSSRLDGVQELLGDLAPKVKVVRTSAPFPSELFPGQPVVANTVGEVSAGAVLGKGMGDAG